MERMKAIRIIVENTLAELSAEERELLLLDYWWGQDETNDEFRQLPLDIQQMIKSSDSPIEPGNSRYDEMILQSLEYKYVGVRNEYLSMHVTQLVGHGVKVTGKVAVLFECPCCGYRSLKSKSCYEICRVCFWEDSGNRDPEWHDGPNHMTLHEGRHNFAAFGASSQRRLRLVDKDGKEKYTKSGALSNK